MTIDLIAKESELANQSHMTNEIELGVLKGEQAKDLAFKTASCTDGYIQEKFVRLLTPAWNRRFPVILGRGGKIRQIIEVSSQKNSLKQTIERLKLKGDIEFRAIRRNSNIHFVILDKHIVWLSLYGSPFRRDMPVLATAEAEITRIYIKLFEYEWNSLDATIIYNGMR